MKTKNCTGFRMGLLLIAALAAAPALQAQTTNAVLFQNDTNSLVTNGLTGMLVRTNEGMRALLYWAPDGTTDESAFVSAGGFAAPIGFGNSHGRYNGGYRTIQTASPPGTPILIQVRAWEWAYGSTYEAALAAAPGTNGRTALVGRSGIARVPLSGGPTNGSQKCGPFTMSLASGGSFIAVNDIVVAEGSNGVYLANFVISLLAGLQAAPVSVDYATSNGTAVAGADYVATSGTVTLQPGERSKVVSVTLTADGPPEPEETFYLKLSNPVNGYLVRAQGSCVVTEVRVTGISIDTSVSFNTVNNRRYMVERSFDSLTWEAVAGATNVLGNGSVLTVLDRGSGCSPMTLYRARLIEE